MEPHLVAVLQIISILVCMSCRRVIDRITAQYHCTPYHTSALSGEDWVQELLSGHPQCIRNELGIYQSTFIVLIKALQMLGLKSLHHVSIEEQLAIFLYTAVTGLSCSYIGECF
jgi:hypothetical protein